MDALATLGSQALEARFEAFPLFGAVSPSGAYRQISMTSRPFSVDEGAGDLAKLLLESLATQTHSTLEDPTFRPTRGRVPFFFDRRS